MIFGLLLALPLAASPQGVESPVEPELREVVPRLRDLMLAGIDTKKPNMAIHRRALRKVGGETIFDGSYDWHSNLFAHWALLVIARTEEDAELEALLLERLTPAALAHEREIAQALNSEMLLTFPYDHGWMLMLLAELERHYDPVPASLREFRVETEARILRWLEENPFPENDDPNLLGGRNFVGFYRSWLFAWLQVALAGPVGEGAAEKLDELARERIAPQRAAIAAHADPHEWDFLWLPAVLALVEDLGTFEGERADEPTPYEAGEPRELPAAVRLSDVHVMGVEISKLWGFAVKMRRGDADASAAFHLRYHEILARPDLWEEDFEVVTHWIPQFLWFAIWVADGRP